MNKINKVKGILFMVGLNISENCQKEWEETLNKCFDKINIGISVKKGNTELLEQLNSALSELNVSNFEEMMNTAISVQPLSE